MIRATGIDWRATNWRALGAEQIDHAPPEGRLVAFHRAVWQVRSVILPIGLDDRDMPVWGAAGRPDPISAETWVGWPYLVDALWIAGHRPADPAADGIPLHAFVRVGAKLHGGARRWNLYPATGRWPQCSCCGEPMPCHADQTAARAAPVAA